MEITTSTPEQIEIQLAFEKPFKSTSTVTLELTPTGNGTQLSWSNAASGESSPTSTELPTDP